MSRERCSDFSSQKTDGRQAYQALNQSERRSQECLIRWVWQVQLWWAPEQWQYVAADFNMFSVYLLDMRCGSFADGLWC